MTTSVIFRGLGRVVQCSRCLGMIVQSSTFWLWSWVFIGGVRVPSDNMDWRVSWLFSVIAQIAVYMEGRTGQGCSYTPPPFVSIGGGGYIGFILSIYLSVVVSLYLIVTAQYLLNFSTIFFFF